MIVAIDGQFDKYTKSHKW